MAYTYEQSYYFRAYAGNSNFWLNRNGSGTITNHQLATLYTATGDPDQRLKIHQVSGGCQLLSDLNYNYGLNIYGSSAGSTCDFYPVEGNFNDSLITLEAVNTENNLYRIKLTRYNLYLTPASDTRNARLTWNGASNGNNQIWKLCLNQTDNSNLAHTIAMAVNVNQNYQDNNSWIRSSGCAVCCGVDIASWKHGRVYSIEDFENYYNTSTGYFWTGPNGFSCSAPISLANYSEQETIAVIRSYVEQNIPVACHATGYNGKQHWFVAYAITTENGSTWATSGIKVLDPYNGATYPYGRRVSIWDAMSTSNVTLGIDRIRIPL